MEIYVYVLSIRVLDALYTYVYSTKEVAKEAAGKYMDERSDINWQWKHHLCWYGYLKYYNEQCAEISIDRQRVLDKIETKEEESE